MYLICRSKMFALENFKLISYFTLKCTVEIFLRETAIIYPKEVFNFIIR